MATHRQILAIALGVGLVLAGCGKPQSQSQPGVDEPAASASADAALSSPSVEPSLNAATNQELSVLTLMTSTPGLTTGPETTFAESNTPGTLLASTNPVPGIAAPNPGASTNETLSGGAGFMRKSLASPFAQAGQALKESYDSALVAVQIGDCERAVTELKALAESPDLTAEQEQAVRDLLELALIDGGLGETALPDPGAGANNGGMPKAPH